MKHHFLSLSRTQFALASRAAGTDPLIEQLEALLPGTRVVTQDGAQFIRTNRTCICFCNLATGCLCSAKDLCYVHGGTAGSGNGQLH